MLDIQVPKLPVTPSQPDLTDIILYHLISHSVVHSNLGPVIPYMVDWRPQHDQFLSIFSPMIAVPLFSTDA
jgi:hypothetical protein